MELVHKGFDGLDISYPLTLPHSIADQLKALKEQAAASRDGRSYFFHGDLIMSVEATGAKGGFAYRCDSGTGTPYGETWFFKHPQNNMDKWGVRVSCKALPLALDGLKAVRERIEDTLGKLGMPYQVGTESLGRVDFAMDFLAPDFALVPDHFVMHARCNRKDHTEIENISSEGHSGRVTSVTIGKNPGRQVIVYDKRAEAVSKRKPYWCSIWNSTRAASGRPPLNMKSRDESQVWRVEMRTYKRHLKDGWNVATWGDLQEALPLILSQVLDDIRYTAPTSDSNRGRWPDHQLWLAARSELSRPLAELKSLADPLSIREMIRDERDEMLAGQIKGLMLSRAGLNDISQAQLTKYLQTTCEWLIEEFEGDAGRTSKKLAALRHRYSLLLPHGHEAE